MPSGHSEFHPDRTLERPWGIFSYSDSGGGPAIIFIHGTGRSRRDWEKVIPHLKERRCIRVDLRGHGGSAVPKEGFTLADLAADVMALADALWLGRLDLAGHSLGGMVALAILRSHPGRIDQVALLEGWPALRFAAAFGSGPVTEGLPATTAKQVDEAHHDTFVRWMPGLRDLFWQAVRAFDATELLRATPHRILAAFGDRGRDRPAAAALGVPRRDNIEIAWLENRGHFMLLEDPAETGRLLRRFFIGGDSPEPPLPPPTLRDLGMGVR